MGPFASSLQGKVGILTGGTSGFGLEMARGLVVQGARLAIFSIDEPSETALAEFRSGGPGEAAFIRKDILAANSADEMVAEALGRFDRLDFVIANAGFAIRFEEPLLEVPRQKLAQAMRTQFEIFPVALATLALAAAKVMAPRYRDIPPDATGHRPDSGAVVVTLSEAAVCPLRDDLLAYAAAKHAALSVMRSLAATLGPLNIRVNGIAPGFANTAGPRKFYDRYPDIRADVEAQNHLQPSFMHPGAVLPAVLYLLTDNYVTGECLMLDGGFNIEMRRYFQKRG